MKTTIKRRLLLTYNVLGMAFCLGMLAPETMTPFTWYAMGFYLATFFGYWLWTGRNMMEDACKEEQGL